MTCARAAAAEKTNTKIISNGERKLDSLPRLWFWMYGRFDASGHAFQLPDAIKKLTPDLARLGLHGRNRYCVNDVFGLATP